MQKKIIASYLVLSALISVSGMFSTAMYVVFLTKNGLNLFEVNLVNSLFFLMLFVCEIPTGAFADIYGRKKSFIVSSILIGFGFLTYGFSKSFWGFVFAEFLVAIGDTFKSGAFQAWLVDSLKHKGFEGDLGKIFSRNTMYCKLIGLSGSIVGGYLGAYYLPLPWFIGAFFAFLTAIVAVLIMKEEYFVPQVFSWKLGYEQLRSTVISSFKYGINEKSVRFVLFISFAQVFMVQPLNMYWQLFFGQKGVTQKHLGFIYAAIMLAVAGGAYIVTKINTKNKERKIIIKSQIFAGLFVIISSVISGVYVSLALFIIHEMYRGVWQPMIDSYLHERIPSHERATVSSFCALFPHIGGALGLFVSGILAKTCGITYTWIISGSMLVVTALLFLKNNKKH